MSTIHKLWIGVCYFWIGAHFSHVREVLLCLLKLIRCVSRKRFTEKIIAIRSFFLALITFLALFEDKAVFCVSEIAFRLLVSAIGFYCFFPRGCWKWYAISLDTVKLRIVKFRIVRDVTCSPMTIDYLDHHTENFRRVFLNFLHIQHRTH